MNITRLFVDDHQTTRGLRFSLTCAHVAGAAVALILVGAALILLAWGISSVRGAIA